MRFFFYGTLMDADVRELVIGRKPGNPDIEPAILSGFRRVYLRGRTYPVVAPNPRDSVEGCLARGLDRTDRDRLTEFETDEYVAVLRDVRVRSGKSVRAWVFTASSRARPTPKPWRFEDWRRRHKADLLRRMRRGMLD